MKHNRILALAFILPALLLPPAGTAQSSGDEILTATPQKQSIRLPEDPIAIFSVTLRNTRDEAQEFEVGGYTPRYIGDPGFDYDFEVGGQVMPKVFYVTLLPGEELPIVLVVTAYHSDNEVPEYWVTVNARSTTTLDAGWDDTFTIRAASNRPADE